MKYTTLGKSILDTSNYGAIATAKNEETAELISDALNSIDESYIKCGFLECEQEAEYEGWHRVLDFASQPTGLIVHMQVCKNHVNLLIGKEATV